ncbi:gamma-glutamylcyclotransferase [Caerostris darwini]|uniref:gamma-glutamylcyclotransferase n=1 Tax=Caerostris darwini TaxID=1538125 RepID=A0AAV4SV42_9ARAC|nr:gamma-glutamylcyclotransferase [Caerostris darwini]
MLAQRMFINCPSAQFKCIGELKNFRLAFAEYCETWKGSSATIIESKGDSVWGVLWEILKVHQEALDRQEVNYNPMIVPVETELFGKLDCRTYQILGYKEDNNMPSRVYKAVCVQGAIDHGLPPSYIKKLEAVADNGYKGPIPVPVNIDL